jgi:hypothetical protein
MPNERSELEPYGVTWVTVKLGDNWHVIDVQSRFAITIFSNPRDRQMAFFLPSPWRRRIDISYRHRLVLITNSLSIMSHINMEGMSLLTDAPYQYFLVDIER